MTSYTYDVVSRLNSQNLDFAGTANDLLIRNMVYNPASQLTSVNRTNDAYAWTGFGGGSTAYTPNGLNQYASIGGAAPTYDADGNMTHEPQSAKTYAYSSENLLTSASGGGAPATTLTYDPLMRLYEDKQTPSGAATRFAYDGTTMIAEYDGSNALQKRYVFGPGVDEPLVQLDAAGNRTWLTADERGSIIALSDDNGNVTQINKYDEYGKPQPGNLGRFQYTGQAWLDDLGTAPASGQGLYYYKSRMYAPHLGRFMQPDPIGYAGGMNVYAYVNDDPVNLIDPLGTQADPNAGPPILPIIVTGSKPTCSADICISGGSLLPNGLELAPAPTYAVAVVVAAAGGASEDDVSRACLIAYTPQGDTRGDNPDHPPPGGGYNTDLPGSTLLDAAAIYVGLTRLAGDTNKRTFPDLTKPQILSRSYPSGIQLRIGRDGRYRIDIPAGTFNKIGGLRVPETIHLRGGRGNMCPTR